METFQVYRHSGKFGVHGLLLAVVGAVVVGFPLGFAYAYLIKWIPFVYLNFLATAGYGFVFGFLAGWLVKFGKVRNGAVACLTGLLAGAIGLYFSWNGHLHALVEGGPVLWMPRNVVNAMKLLYEEGSWGLRSGGPVTGVPLAIVWIIEAGIVIGIATVVCYGMIAQVPFCETSQCWLDQEKKIDTLETFANPAHLAAFQAGDLGPLAQARPRTPGIGAWTRLTLKHSPRCPIFHTVRLQDITIEVDKNGNSKEKVKDLTGDLILPASMMELISKFEHFSASPTPSPVD